MAENKIVSSNLAVLATISYGIFDLCIGGDILTII